MTSRPKSQRIVFSREFFEELYVKRGLTPTQISQEIGYSKSWVTEQLRAFDIAVRLKRNLRETDVRDAWLRQQYVERHRSLGAIGQEIGWGAHSVRRHLLAIGVPLRSKGGQTSLTDKAWLVEQYWERNRSLQEVAAEAKCGLAFLRRELRRHGIPQKPRGVTLRTAYASGFTGVSRRPNNFGEGERLRILRRDGVRCVLCHTDKDLQCHHIIPARLGGPATVANGITLCERCHGKMAKHELDYVEQLLTLRGQVQAG